MVLLGTESARKSAISIDLERGCIVTGTGRRVPIRASLKNATAVRIGFTEFGEAEI